MLPNLSLRYFSDFATAMAMDGKDVAIRIAGNPAILLESWMGCGACGKHALVVGGDWLAGDEEAARRSQFSVCSKCVRTFYCGRDCQRAHWARHKNACRARPTADLVFVDLGRSASAATKAAAVAEYRRLSDLPAPAGALPPPIPTYVDARGCRRML
jgi:hypothetical protein